MKKAILLLTVVIGGLKAQTCTPENIYVTHTPANYQLAPAGRLCAGVINTVIFQSATQKAIALCVATAAPVNVQLTTSGDVYGPVWVNFVANVSNQCYNIPAAIEGLRIVPTVNTTGNIGLGVL